MSPALQISIPTASVTTPAEGKPYTVYHITLQLPLRKLEVRKRYSEFLDLQSALTTETGSSPPVPLPGKSWIRRTVSSAALTDERRKSLEAYLQAIIASDDARWRSSAAWRNFLNLPTGTSTLNANGSLTASQSGSANSSSLTDPNRWLDVHRDVKSQIQTARQQLKQREAATTALAQHKLSADAKASLVRAATAIAQLDDGLKNISTASKGDDAGWGGRQKLGDGELRRRRDLLVAARKEVEGLEGVLRSLAVKSVNASSGINTPAAASEGDKEALWRGSSAAKPGGRVLGGPLKETARTRELDNAGVLQLQQQVMQEQDEDVLALGKTVAKLKDMGILINEELAIQNEMLGIIDADVDRHQAKLDIAKRRIGKIS